MVRRYLPKNTEELIHWYERYVSPLALITGFLIDNFLLLDRVDVLWGNVLIGAYLVIAALSILFINLVESGRWTHRWVLASAPFIPVVMQFTFGGLFSGFLALYSRSAGMIVSWLFVIAIAALLVGNERFRRLYTRFVFQISILFTAIFLFLLYIVPVVLRQIGDWIFVLSGILSVIVMALFMWLLRKIVPDVIRQNRANVLTSLMGIFVAFNVLYFTNTIPPLPLSLKEAGVYHGLTRAGNTYTLLAEPSPWYKKYLTNSSIYHRAPGESVYAFSAVFAPNGLETTIYHEWQRYDEELDKWINKGTLEFPIRGGRDGGYRGYTLKNDVPAGSWRVNVLTESGQVVGRVSFLVEDVPTKVPIVQETY